MQLRPGQMFVDHYRIESELGAGGFGVVYLATDRRNGRQVAIKVLQSDDRDARARFAREVAVVARLKSPYTVELLESGQADDGTAYAVFEYIAGSDLADVLEERGRLPAPVARHILMQLLSSLGEAHRNGLLHRDLKPENVRVFEHDGDPWRVKLLDFGIARSTDAGHPQLTATGELIGTPRYMSPEQLTGKPLTPASDVYSLGVVVYEMLVGREALHGGRWGDQLERLMTQHLMDPSVVADAGDLAPIVIEMTHTRPEQRLRTVDAVLRSLHGDREGSVAPDQPERSDRTQAMMIAIVGAILAATVGVGYHAYGLLSDEAPHVAQPRTELPEFVQSDEPSSAARAGLDLGRRHAAADFGTTLRAPNDGAPVRSIGCSREGLPHTRTKLLRPDTVLGLDPWLTHIPDTMQPDEPRPHPLVMLLHDHYQTPQSLLENSGFVEVADRLGFVIVAPQSNTLTVKPAWEDDNPRRLTEIADETAARLCIDRSRMFVVAQGRSGQMFDKMMCEPWVRAGARHGFRKTAARYGAHCARDKPVMLLSGMKSIYYPVKGGPNCLGNDKLSLAEEYDLWHEAYGCSEEKRTWFQTTGGTCEKRTCETPFVTCELAGGSAWPGTAEGRPFPMCEPPLSAPFPAAERVWAFFEEVTGARISGCGASAPPTGKQLLYSAGLEPWITYVPTSYEHDKPAPLVMMLHPALLGKANESPASFLKDSGFIELAERHGFVVVAPEAQAPLDPWKGPHEFLTSIVLATTAQLCIDESRQFVVAHAQGGRVAEALTCDPWIDGVAWNSHRSSNPGHNCDDPAPVMMVSATESQRNPIDGGRNCQKNPKAPLAAIEQSWRRRNQCSHSKKSVRRAEGACDVYEGCAAPLVSCRLDGGWGWPGVKSALNVTGRCDEPPVADFPTAETIWSFLADLPGTH